MDHADQKTSMGVRGELDDALDNSFPASDPAPMTDPTHDMRTNSELSGEEEIRQRAYEIWQRAGSPDGAHEEHWQQAKNELEAEAARAHQSDEEPITPTTAEQVR